MDEQYQEENKEQQLKNSLGYTRHVHLLDEPAYPSDSYQFKHTESVKKLLSILRNQGRKDLIERYSWEQIQIEPWIGQIVLHYHLALKDFLSSIWLYVCSSKLEQDIQKE